MYMDLAAEGLLEDRISADVVHDLIGARHAVHGPASASAAPVPMNTDMLSLNTQPEPVDAPCAYGWTRPRTHSTSP